MMQPFSTAESSQQGLYVSYCNLALFYLFCLGTRYFISAANLPLKTMLLPPKIL